MAEKKAPQVTEEDLKSLLNEAVSDLRDRVKSKKATASELALALKLCKDHNIMVNPEKHDAFKDLVASLPDLDLPEVKIN